MLVHVADTYSPTPVSHNVEDAMRRPAFKCTHATRQRQLNMLGQVTQLKCSTANAYTVMTLPGDKACSWVAFFDEDINPLKASAWEPFNFQKYHQHMHCDDTLSSDKTAESTTTKASPRISEHHQNVIWLTPVECRPCQAPPVYHLRTPDLRMGVTIQSRGLGCAN